MPYQGLKIGSVRDAAFSLRTTRTLLDAVLDDLASAADTGGLWAEVGPTSQLAGELSEELDLLGQLLDAKATAMELADVGLFGTEMSVLGHVNRLSSELRASLADQIGFQGTTDELRSYYEAKAFESAGIDPTQWRPELGLDANNESVERVYAYYADLYRSDPDTFWWAGMAAVIGPSFIGGFNDLETAADAFNRIGTISTVAAPLVADGSNVTERDLRWYQSRLLMMQKEIFLDMATAHEAYLDGGMFAIEQLYENDPYRFRDKTVGAWRQIDEGARAGQPDLIASGNATLLRREQRYVIDDDYELMYSRPMTGEAVTYLMTALGTPSIPGAKSFPELYPHSFDVSQYAGSPRKVTVIPWVYTQSVPHVGAEATVTIETPFPDGNIAIFDDRWKLIEDDTLPRWTDLAENHQSEVLELLDIPVADRGDEFDFLSRADEIARWYLWSGWDADLDVDWEVGW